MQVRYRLYHPFRRHLRTGCPLPRAVAVLDNDTHPYGTLEVVPGAARRAAAAPNRI